MVENKNAKTSADGGTGFNYFRASAITVLRQAPVDADDTSQKRVDEKEKREHEWVGLTDEEIHEIDGYEEDRKMYRFARAIEAKLKEKNT